MFNEKTVPLVIVARPGSRRLETRVLWSLHINTPGQSTITLQILGLKFVLDFWRFHSTAKPSNTFSIRATVTHMIF